MRRTHLTPFLLLLAVLLPSCGRQPVAPERTTVRPGADASSARIEGLSGPTLCFHNGILDYCYPGGGYCPCPATEVPLAVRAGQPVTMNWSATTEPGARIVWYRWAVDIEDVTDDTPRVDEETDLSHWSTRSAEVTSAHLGPWGDGEQHRLYVDVADDRGLRSLGIVRFEASATANHPPDCSGATGELELDTSHGRSFARVAILGVIDPDGDPVTVTVTGVTQDEPLDGVGDGHTCPDAMLEGGVASVRVERAGTGNGRVYTLAFTADDGLGGSCAGSVDVCIPRGRTPCVKDALVVNSLGSCDSP